MNTPTFRLALLLLCAALGALPLRAESTAQERATWTKAADNHIYAQQLVNEIVAGHPELLVIGMHGAAPGTDDHRMIASNLDRIGKKDDDDDIGVAAEHKTICAPNLKETFKFEVLMPLKDASGTALNAAIGFVFKYNPGDDEVGMHARAVKIRDELAKKIPTYADLFKPAP